MRKLQRTLVVFFYTSLVYWTCAHCLDKAEFSLKLRQEAERILGIDEFQNYLEPHINRNLRFMASAPNGLDHVQWIASEISRHVRDRANGVKRLKNAIKQSFKTSTSTVMPRGCPSDNLGLQQDPRFPVKVSTNTGCLFGKEPPTENGKPVLEGISNELLKAQEFNLRTIPGVKWQYFGTKDGVMYSYPAKDTCHLPTYDPRLRPWYSFAATDPKDIIVMIDMSSSMLVTYLTSGEKKLTVAIKAAQAAIKSLNPNDNVGVLAFDNEVLLPISSDSCYGQQLALATKTNKEALTDFVNELPTDSTHGAVYSSAFERAYRLFSATSNSSESTTRKKVILLLANGDPLDNLTTIKQSIVAGNQLVGTQVTILSFGMNTDAREDSILRSISEQSGGQYHRLNDPDPATITMRIGVYYNYFPKLGDDNEVVFTVPYNDSGGFGMVTSACLPIVAAGDFQGVTCMDIPIDSLFSPIVDFHLGRLSYAFLIDSQGRVLLHPLLPKPETYKQEPIFLDMESVEISQATVAVKASMISGSTGNMTVTDLRLFSSRGYSLHDGVTLYVGKATYYWAPISVMNASVCLVVVDGEKNISVSWTGAYPQILLTDELSLDDTNGRCNNFGRIASTDTSAVKLSLKCFVEPYNYTQQVFTTDQLQQFKNYLRNQTTETTFTVTPGVRESIAMTHELESIWKRSAAATSNTSDDVGHLNEYALFRYVGTREGVYRIYPAIGVATKFDPTKQPWYRRAEAQRGRVTLSTQTDSNGYVTTSLAMAYVDTNDAGPANDILGVVGADVPASSIYNFLRTEFDPCIDPNTECFAIDRSGFVIAHQDFLVNPPSAQVHITTKEPEIAADMVSRNIVTGDSCVNYADITNQRFYMVELHGGERALTNGRVYAISEVDMSVVVKYQHSNHETGTCLCPRIIDDSDRIRCEPGPQCQCPCYTSTDYSYCNGHFTINNTKTCYPPTLPIYLVDLSVEERSVASSLSACLHCPLIADEKLCNTTGCCWNSGNCLTCYSPGNEPCDSLCLGLAIGLSVVLVVVVVVIIIVVFAWQTGRLSGLRSPTAKETSTDAADALPHKTVIYVVGAEDKSSGLYSEIRNTPPTTPDSTDGVYLHLEDPAINTAL